MSRKVRWRVGAVAVVGVLLGLGAWHNLGAEPVLEMYVSFHAPSEAWSLSLNDGPPAGPDLTLRLSDFVRTGVSNQPGDAGPPVEAVLRSIGFEGELPAGEGSPHHPMGWKSLTGHGGPVRARPVRWLRPGKRLDPVFLLARAMPGSGTWSVAVVRLYEGGGLAPIGSWGSSSNDRVDTALTALFSGGRTRHIVCSVSLCSDIESPISEPTAARDLELVRAGADGWWRPPAAGDEAR